MNQPPIEPFPEVLRFELDNVKGREPFSSNKKFGPNRMGVRLSKEFTGTIGSNDFIKTLGP